MHYLTEERGTIRLEEVLQGDDFCHLSCCPEQVNYRAGENIYSPGDITKQIYRIHRGKVKLSHLDESGRRLTLAVLGEGEVFGEVALPDDGGHQFFADAWEDSCICPIDLRQLQRCFKEDAEVALGMLQLIGRREEKLLEKLFRLHFHSVPQRIAEELLELANKWGQPCAEGITIQITHQELADLIGTARETATTALNYLKQEGLLNTDGAPRRHFRRIVIADLRKLREVADGHQRVSVGKRGVGERSAADERPPAVLGLTNGVPLACEYPHDCYVR